VRAGVERRERRVVAAGSPDRGLRRDGKNAVK